MAPGVLGMARTMRAFGPQALRIRLRWRARGDGDHQRAGLGESRQHVALRSFRICGLSATTQARTLLPAPATASATQR